MKETLTLSFAAKKENVRIVRAVIRNFLILRGVLEQDIFDTELALDEAVANVIEHTYKCDPSKYIVLTLNWEDGILDVLLRDFGEKVDPASIKPRALDEVREGGLGVYIIKKIFDVVEWVEKVERGNLLHLRKSFNIPRKE